MILLNPKQHDRYYPDERSRQIMRKTIAFFENKGLKKVKEDDHARAWYATSWNSSSRRSSSPHC